MFSFFKKPRSKLVLYFNDQKLTWYLEPNPHFPGQKISGSIEAVDLGRVFGRNEFRNIFDTLQGKLFDIEVLLDSHTCDYFYFSQGKKDSTPPLERVEKLLENQFGQGLKERNFSFYSKKLGSGEEFFGATYPKSLFRFFQQVRDSLAPESGLKIIPANLIFWGFTQFGKEPHMVLRLGEVNSGYLLIDGGFPKTGKVISYGVNKLVDSMIRERGVEKEMAAHLIFKSGFMGPTGPLDPELIKESQAITVDFQGFLKRLRKVLDFGLMTNPEYKNLPIHITGPMVPMENLQFQLESGLKRRIVLEKGDHSEQGTQEEWVGLGICRLFLDSIRLKTLPEIHFTAPPKIELKKEIGEFSIGKPLFYSFLLTVLFTWIFLLYFQGEEKKKFNNLRGLEAQFEEKTKQFHLSRAKVDLLKKNVETIKSRPTRFSRISPGFLQISLSPGPGIQFQSILIQENDSHSVKYSEVLSFQKFLQKGHLQNAKFQVKGTSNGKGALEDFLDALQARSGFKKINLTRTNYSDPKKILFEMTGEFEFK